jgi:tRNA 2-thiouridine synthesizing protein A
VSNQPKIEELDLCGLTCPLPVLRAQKKLRELALGAELIVLADDPIARIDFPHYCEQSGNTLLSLEEEAGTLKFHLRKTA